jgi:transcriptional regulator with XRE-family HTH domain
MEQAKVFEIIESERVKQNISLRQMGKMSGLSHATYQSALRLNRGMTLESICKLLDVVGYRLKVEKR